MGGDVQVGEEIALPKKKIEAAMKMAMRDAFAGFDEIPNDARACFIGVHEDLERSAWRGEWTERIRQIVREQVPSVTCVCVKPLPIGKEVWYSVDVM